MHSNQVLQLLGASSRVAGSTTTTTRASTRVRQAPKAWEDDSKPQAEPEKGKAKGSAKKPSAGSKPAAKAKLANNAEENQPAEDDTGGSSGEQTCGATGPAGGATFAFSLLGNGAGSGRHSIAI